MEGFEDLDDEMDVEIITALDENGNDIEFIILDTIEYNNVAYLLVVESEFADNDEIETVILKETKEDVDVNGIEYSNYSFIEDENEFNEVVKLFQDTDDYTIET